MIKNAIASVNNCQENESELKWNDEWTQYIRKEHSFRPELSYWDDRAYKYMKKDGNDPYEESFYEMTRVKPGERVFDMGCGAGTMTIAFAQKGHEVYGADFSSKMLERMMEDAKTFGLDSLIHPIMLDWNEDWGMRELPLCEIVICSRALIFENLDESIRKLEGIAERRVCLGILDEIYDDRPGQSEIILNYLKARGIEPEFEEVRFRPGNERRLDAIETLIAWDK
ncbi:MAG: methyltransferase domain-containing protein [Clostridiales bacterium]|nr:methyltransferase domain-containing protein [Candidatus Crickella caballi]